MSLIIYVDIITSLSHTHTHIRLFEIYTRFFQHNNEIVAQWLLEAGADPNCYDESTGCTALHIAGREM